MKAHEEIVKEIRKSVQEHLLNYAKSLKHETEVVSTEIVVGDFDYIHDQEERMNYLKELKRRGVIEKIRRIKRTTPKPVKNNHTELEFEYNMEEILERKSYEENFYAPASPLLVLRVTYYPKKLEELILSEKIISAEKNGMGLSFDDKRGILSLYGRKIKISERTENDAVEILRILLKDPKKVWENVEVLDEWQFNKTKEDTPKNKVYQAGKALNRIIAQNTMIKDFLEPLTTRLVAINRKYLS